MSFIFFFFNIVGMVLEIYRDVLSISFIEDGCLLFIMFFLNLFKFEDLEVLVFFFFISMMMFNYF